MYNEDIEVFTEVWRYPLVVSVRRIMYNEDIELFAQVLRYPLVVSVRRSYTMTTLKYSQRRLVILSSVLLGETSTMRTFKY